MNTLAIAIGILIGLPIGMFIGFDMAYRRMDYIVTRVFDNVSKRARENAKNT